MVGELSLAGPLMFADDALWTLRSRLRVEAMSPERAHIVLDPAYYVRTALRIEYLIIDRLPRCR